MNQDILKQRKCDYVNDVKFQLEKSGIRVIAGCNIFDTLKFAESQGVLVSWVSIKMMIDKNESF